MSAKNDPDFVESFGDADIVTKQPPPSDLAETAHKRLDDIEALLARIVKHLDPHGTSRSLFPVDKEGNPL